MKTLLLQVTRPATVPVPCQSQPAAANVPPIEPAEKLITPPATETLPVMRADPASVLGRRRPWRN